MVGNDLTGKFAISYGDVIRCGAVVRETLDGSCMCAAPLDPMRECSLKPAYDRGNVGSKPGQLYPPTNHYGAMHTLGRAAM